MAEKIKTNETGDCIFTEQNAIELLYQNPQLDISKLFFEDTEQFNKSVDQTGINLTKLSQKLMKIQALGLLQKIKMIKIS